MGQFSDDYKDIKRGRQNIVDGNINMIPLGKWFPRLARLYPGMIKGDTLLSTASTGVGKSKFARMVCMRIPLHIGDTFSGVKVEVIVNSLEEDTSKVRIPFVQERLSAKHNINLTYREIYGKNNNDIGKDKVDLIKKITDELDEKYNDRLYVIDETDPMRIYAYILNFMKTRGTFWAYNSEGIANKLDSKDVGLDNWHFFKYHNPNHFVVFILDTINNLSVKASGKEKWNFVVNWAFQFVRNKICKKMGVIFCYVQQQAGSQEHIKVSNRGQTIIETLEPSLSGLGEYKPIGNDATMSFGIFDPGRYGGLRKYETNFGTFTVSEVSPYFRGLLILKNREGGNYPKRYPVFAHMGIEFMEGFNFSKHPNIISKLKKG